MRYFFSCVLLCCVWICSAQQREQIFIPFEEAYKRVYHIQRVDNVNIVVDGKLDEPIWQDPEGWTDYFVVAVPVERLLPDSRTRAKLFHDGRYLYVGF